MGNIAESIQQEMTCEPVFTIPIFGGIKVYESVVVTCIMSYSCKKSEGEKS